jgi:hypothetical protein
MKIPISLIIDDPTPVLNNFYLMAKSGTTSYEHARLRLETKDGRPLIKKFPRSLLLEFCDTVERRGIKGKFSVVPMPGNGGDIVNGIEDVSEEELRDWIDTVKTRIEGRFTIGPEMLTHNLAVDLKSGGALPTSEPLWSQNQGRSTLTPYIARAVSLLCEAGFDAFGVTSPWKFGISVEDEYAAAISRAVFDVTGKRCAWYFLRGLRDVPNAKPWVQLEEDGRTLVSIPATTNDVIWQTMDSPDTSDGYISEIADMLITKDGSAGEIIRVINTGGYPILVTHWQSLMSNGLGTGIRILDEVARRVNENLGDKVEWMSFAEIMELVIKNKSEYPKPSFD